MFSRIYILFIKIIITCRSSRKGEGNAFLQTTWQIKFKLDEVNKNGIYKLRVAIAMSAVAELQVSDFNKKTLNFLALFFDSFRIK